MTNLAGNLQNGIRINGKHSYRDFGLFVSKKVIEMPSVKRIRETVPYMNGSHDFSKLNGELAYEDRIISYTFDITGNDAEEMNKRNMMFLHGFVQFTKKISKMMTIRIYISLAHTMNQIGKRMMDKAN